ncbi:dTDP-glucose 4,6-dehydratase [Ktedonobacteria bacterium brp13]|nr:dTDP-glucose 4,6-dehydratase [Ktedonobacteria bacterium brp13]
MEHPTIMVTGGAGFIGSNFVHHILYEMTGARVIVFDKLTYAGNLENLADIIKDKRVTFIQGDICNRQIVTEVMSACDWVVNFAAETHVDRSIAEPEAFIATDIMGAFTLLEVAREYKIKRFMQISTDEVYGNAEAPGGMSRPSLESDALKPLSPYAASKAGADRLAFSYWATFGLPVIITRCSNNYGPYQYPEKQLPLYICNALSNRELPVYGDGKSTRDWIHVEDHCAALSLLLRAPLEQVAGEVFNISGNEERSILENALAVLKITGQPDSLLSFVTDRPGHVLRHAVNAEKLEKRLGWQPHRRFSEGILQTVTWYREHPEWIQHILARHDSFLEHALIAGAHEIHRQ